VGGQTGINLIYPVVIKNTIILQTTSRAMFGARLDLRLYNNEPIFYNSATKISLENNLTSINHRLNSKDTPEAEKVQWQKTKEDTERTLSQLQGKNVFTNSIIPLQEQMKDHPEIKKMVEAYKAKNQMTENPLPPK
jgi:predicted  nucleic acid-binding Zn ribbon protein